MEEIADTFDAVGVTPDFHRGAADIFRLVDAGLTADEDAAELALADAIALLAGIDR